MAIDVSPRNWGAAVPAVQSDLKSKRGNSHQRRRQGRRERWQGQKSSPPRRIVIYRTFPCTIRMGLGPDASKASIAVPAASRPVRLKIEARRPESAAAQGRRQDQTSSPPRNRENFAIRTVLGIGTGNSSAVSRTIGPGSFTRQPVWTRRASHPAPSGWPPRGGAKVTWFRFRYSCEYLGILEKTPAY